jgi:hypothetical protein
MKLKIMLVSLGLLGALAAGCNGGGDSGGLNLSGNWTLRVQQVSNTCGLPPVQTQPVQVTATQSGNRVTFQAAGGGSLRLTGELNGSTLRLEGSDTDTFQGCSAAGDYEGTGQASEQQITGALSLQLAIRPRGTCLLNRDCTLNLTFTMTRN